MYNKFILPFIFLCALSLQAQIPSYYAGVNFEAAPETIESQLAQLIINTHTTLLPYTSSNTDTWDAVRLTDEVTTDNTLVYLVYGFDNNDDNTDTDYTRAKSLSCHTSGCSGLWNREHIFPKSLANPALFTSSPSAGTDVHNLRACDGDMNSSRSNRLYQDDTGNSHITSLGNWYPGDEWKGDVARTIMYMYLRYGNQCLPNNVASSTNTYHQVMPDVFLDWNVQDPVSQTELLRNEVLESLQGNRNPFIDNPYLATLLWGGNTAIDAWNTLSSSTVSESHFTVYPTITYDRLEIKGIKNSFVDYLIYGVSGQLVYNSKTTSLIDVSALDSGVYILKLVNSSGSSQNIFFVKK